MVSAPLTSVNLLLNDTGEAAADVVRAAEQHGKIQTLCGIKPDQKEADFSHEGLKAADAVLLAYDIKVNTPRQLFRGKMQLAARFRMLQSVPSSDAHKPRNSRISLSVGFFSTPLTTLNLYGNEIGVEGAKAIAGALPR